MLSFILGLVFLACSVINLIGVLGFYKYKNFFVRLHAATVSTIGGVFYPLLILSIITFIKDEVTMSMSFLLAAILVVILSPTGTHALAKATYKKKIAIPEPLIEDHLKEERGDM